jgi:protein-S-isoprenylcysteine O-methyltransferase Ste14
VILWLRGAFTGVGQVAVLSAFLLLPAGTWDWPRALVFIAGHGILVQIAVALLAVYAPESLRARLQPAWQRSQPTADKVVTAVMGASLLSWIVFISLDVFRWQLLPAPPVWLSSIGGVASVTGLMLLIASLFQNKFAAPIVKDQSERGQTVIDTGLYGHVRHPFYAGFCLYLAGMPLWLESWTGFLLVPVMLLPLLARIAVEEKSLRAMLPDYADYMTRVKYRIVPGIW